MLERTKEPVVRQVGRGLRGSELGRSGKPRHSRAAMYLRTRDKLRRRAEHRRNMGTNVRMAQLYPICDETSAQGKRRWA
jgi:hypothetical protein